MRVFSEDLAAQQHPLADQAKDLLLPVEGVSCFLQLRTFRWLCMVSRGTVKESVSAVSEPHYCRLHALHAKQAHY